MVGIQLQLAVLLISKSHCCPVEQWKNCPVAVLLSILGTNKPAMLIHSVKASKELTACGMYITGREYICKFMQVT